MSYQQKLSTTYAQFLKWVTGDPAGSLVTQSGSLVTRFKSYAHLQARVHWVRGIGQVCNEF